MSLGGTMEHNLGDVVKHFVGRRLVNTDPLYQRYGRKLKKARREVEKQKGAIFDTHGTKRKQTFSLRTD